LDAVIELVLSGGRRLHIAKGVDEQTMRSVLMAVEREWTTFRYRCWPVGSSMRRAQQDLIIHNVIEFRQSSL
jgi:hypothetical protein